MDSRAHNHTYAPSDQPTEAARAPGGTSGRMLRGSKRAALLKLTMHSKQARAASEQLRKTPCLKLTTLGRQQFMPQLMPQQFEQSAQTPCSDVTTAGG